MASGATGPIARSSSTAHSLRSAVSNVLSASATSTSLLPRSKVGIPSTVSFQHTRLCWRFSMILQIHIDVSLAVSATYPHSVSRPPLPNAVCASISALALCLRPLSTLSLGTNLATYVLAFLLRRRKLKLPRIFINGSLSSFTFGGSRVTHPPSRGSTSLQPSSIGTFLSPDTAIRTMYVSVSCSSHPSMWDHT